ncbi:hypothetical protein [Nonomuraea sp. NPDC049504]|uniref:hypothetical protein n=1 Tax=Nonomuraea sp. NPDC049504 TaxID=3154729 RepID=UPI003432FEBE
MAFDQSDQPKHSHTNDDDCPPHLMARPDNLAPGDHWARYCDLCGTHVQQGSLGFSAHMQTVHPEKSA